MKKAPLGSGYRDGAFCVSRAMNQLPTDSPLFRKGIGMIATASSLETVHHEESRASWKKTKPDISVEIHRELLAELNTAFRLDGVNYQTTGKHLTCRKIVAYLTHMALSDDGLTFRINQSLLGKQYSPRIREALISYLHDSSYFEVSQKHSSGHHCTEWKLRDDRLYRVHGEQHNLNGRSSYYDLIVATVDGCGGNAASCGRSPLFCWPDDTTSYVLDGTWVSEYWNRFRTAQSMLWPYQWAFLDGLKAYTDDDVCRVLPLDRDLCLTWAERRQAKKAELLIKHQQRQKARGFTLGESVPKVEAITKVVDRWQSTWAIWDDERIRRAWRHEGRLYYPLVWQPRDLRQNNIELNFEGRWQGTAEVDLSASYWVLLASALTDVTDDVRQLRSDLRSGQFYERLAKAAGEDFAAGDRDLLKISVQIDCLFGRSDFGKGPLWAAMSRIYPSLARFIRDKRNRHDASWLSKWLTKREGALFIDAILPAIYEAKIPALPVHDGIVVPVSASEMVRRICEDVASQKLGFMPFFKAK